jgi:hypothetical protein
MTLGKLLTAALAALAAAACSPQSGNANRDAAKRDAVAQNRPPILDTCEVARHPERFDGQRVRLRAIIIQDIEMADLTLPQCMWRRWDGKVAIDQNKGGADFSAVDAAVMEARRRSTDTRWFAAEGEFEGILRARSRVGPRNAPEPMPVFVAMIEVGQVDHVRLVEIPVVRHPELP